MRNRKRQRGQSVLESAFVLLGLVLLITATIDVGQVMMFMQYFSERARAGARYATVNDYDPDLIRNVVVYNTANPADTTQPGLMGLTTANVNVKRHDAGTDTDRIEVAVENFQLQFYTPFLGGVFQPKPFRTVIPAESLGVWQ
jgi:hypothetical protein